MKKRRNNRGSLTIIIIYIFIIISIFASCICMFAVLQVSLSKNQLKKIQHRYTMEDDLNRLVYDEEKVDKYISERIFNIFRLSEVNKNTEFSFKIDKDDILKQTIMNASFSLEMIDEKTNIVLYLHLDYGHINGEITAIGPCISDIYELKNPLMIEEELPDLDRVIFEEFMEQLENENCDYDYKKVGMSERLNTSRDIDLQLGPLVDESQYAALKYKFVNIFDKTHHLAQYNNGGYFLLNLKRNSKENKSLTIGSLDEDETIISKGVLYIEGDLIINQDFEFSGIIVINDGSIIVNTTSKPRIKGMVVYRGSNIERDSLNIVYDQESIYAAASFLPGFIDVRIDTVRRY